MITLSQRLKKQQEDRSSNTNRISIRDKLLIKESQEMAQLLPSNCSVFYENENDLSKFILTVRPTEGLWEGGTFRFAINVTEEYNMVPPTVRCLTRLWHPNITEVGEVCLSLLRQHSMDGLGWSPIRRLNDVVWGLHALFTDLLNFDDPLNIEASDMYRNSKEEFRMKVNEYVMLYAKD
ncbi:NEDD8-conjugating enzyme UBE2F [Tribolium castaneum]|uniref:E2 NEDD8-conjugating enzyme n=1 Tax=Tribolium castaneum TaxID=7070 RepID=D6W707_TRICA|nr:PREDICTED: NEDD8-conjugating enzyme UBE2F [Tribolium castaneum]EFA11491.1 Nedd8-conjugating enzyme Ubc12-like Protein [Tribolium castaneum]|eukprot:XP_970516.1 PREDICTED: NEDD8-conjugating enzyme UBE2F [Tribolium castaneum]